MEIDMEIDDLRINEDDSEYEEEEYFVYIDIDSSSLAEDQLKDSKNIKMFGLETKKPLLQINNQFFEGEFDFSMGTHVFFEKDNEKPVDELYVKCDGYYKCCAKTNKLLKMSRVLIKDKATDTKISQEKDIPCIKEQLTIQRSYEQALNLFLDPGRQPPRKIPDELNCAHLVFPTNTQEDVNEETPKSSDKL